MWAVPCRIVDAGRTVGNAQPGYLARHPYARVLIEHRLSCKRKEEMNYITLRARREVVVKNGFDSGLSRL